MPQNLLSRVAKERFLLFIWFTCVCKLNNSYKPQVNKTCLCLTHLETSVKSPLQCDNLLHIKHQREWIFTDEMTNSRTKEIIANKTISLMLNIKASFPVNQKEKKNNLACLMRTISGHVSRSSQHLLI
ncbi:hypothetical protein ILYODFUR_006397 [Ilyodon furcidens]|uniref:Secreted protein n=1 Tax=Ilyodon furcidens TaxID=33524 RepID=A0ABV0VBN2_9TELE